MLYKDIVFDDAQQAPFEDLYKLCFDSIGRTPIPLSIGVLPEPDVPLSSGTFVNLNGHPVYLGCTEDGTKFIDLECQNAPRR